MSENGKFGKIAAKQAQEEQQRIESRRRKFAAIETNYERFGQTITSVMETLREDIHPNLELHPKGDNIGTIYHIDRYRGYINVMTSGRLTPDTLTQSWILKQYDYRKRPQSEKSTEIVDVSLVLDDSYKPTGYQVMVFSKQSTVYRPIEQFSEANLVEAINEAH